MVDILASSFVFLSPFIFLISSDRDTFTAVKDNTVFFSITS